MTQDLPIEFDKKLLLLVLALLNDCLLCYRYFSLDIIECPDTESECLDHAEQLLNNGLYSDITLVIDDQEFHCHRACPCKSLRILQSYVSVRLERRPQHTDYLKWPQSSRHDTSFEIHICWESNSSKVEQ